MGRHMVIVILLAAIILIFMASRVGRKKDQAFIAKSIREPFERRLRTGHTGAMTAMQAMEAALMIAQAEARSARPVLRGVFTGNVGLDGRSLSWDVFLTLPGHSRCNVLIEADPLERDPDQAVMVAAARFTPLFEGMDQPGGGSGFRRLASMRRKEYERAQAAEPSFPLDFIDSPKAMDELKGIGLDPSLSDRDIALASLIQESGRPVWQATLAEYSWQAPFAGEEE